MDGDYVELNGVRSWYATQGSGAPVVLLHGGLTDSRDFRGNLDQLSSRFRLYLPERRAHGHTPDVHGPLSVDVMAADTIAFLEQVVGEPAHLVGYSAGANVALVVATQRPDLVLKLVLISGAFASHGMVVKPTAGGTPPAPLLDAYAEVSPDGREHFRTVIDKVAAAANLFAVTPQALGVIRSPTLIIAADDDIIVFEHTVELYRALPDAGLAVIPYSSHLLLREHPQALTELVGEFLETDPHPRLMPLRQPIDDSTR